MTGLPPQESLRPFIAPIPDLSRDWNFIGALGVGVFLVLVAISFLFWQAQRKPHLVRPRALHEEALASLLSIESSGDLDVVDLKPAFLAMSEVFHHYLGRRFGFEATDKTSPELLSRLVGVHGSHEWTDAMRQWLTQYDQVKYADTRLGADDVREALATVRSLIARTRHDAMAQERPRVVARA